MIERRGVNNYFFLIFLASGKFPAMGKRLMEQCRVEVEEREIKEGSE